MISTKQNGYQPNPCGIENPVPPKTGSNVDFASYHKKQLVRFCKKFHKDCYRLIGQKMALKDKVAELEKENAELNEQVAGMINGAFNICQNDNDRLREENAGLRARLNAINFLTPELERESRLKKQELIKAKEQIEKAVEIIRELGGIVREGVTCHYLVDYGALHRATLFLKEIEK